MRSSSWPKPLVSHCAAACSQCPETVARCLEGQHAPPAGPPCPLSPGAGHRLPLAPCKMAPAHLCTTLSPHGRLQWTITEASQRTHSAAPLGRNASRPALTQSSAAAYHVDCFPIVPLHRTLCTLPRLASAAPPCASPAWTATAHRTKPTLCQVPRPKVRPEQGSGGGPKRVGVVPLAHLLADPVANVLGKAQGVDQRAHLLVDQAVHVLPIACQVIDATALPRADPCGDLFRGQYRPSGAPTRCPLDTDWGEGRC